MYNVDLTAYFDNREYQQPIQTPQTLFGTRLSPELGVSFTDHQGGIHRIIAGVHYIQPLGSNWREALFLPTVYYNFNNKGFHFFMGAIPYKHRIETLPDYLMYDSIAYYHPNIQGALIQYQSKHGFVELMCDWRGRQTPIRREMFRLVLNGRYEYNCKFQYFVGGNAQMNHKANYAAPTEREGVCDDILLAPYLGVDFARPTVFDSLALRVSYITGLQRYRMINAQEITQGVYAEAFLKWRFLGAKNSFYAGRNMMPYYQTFGSDLNQGDPFFQADWYNRTDLFIYIIR
ncbi:MAG: hypothetical protein Q4D14_04335, partial [Bacteroidales bacterium]|nr:hypothetical protein [Bacteroidales bacterium]